MICIGNGCELTFSRRRKTADRSFLSFDCKKKNAVTILSVTKLAIDYSIGLIRSVRATLEKKFSNKYWFRYSIKVKTRKIVLRKATINLYIYIYISAVCLNYRRGGGDTRNFHEMKFVEKKKKKVH